MKWVCFWLIFKATLGFLCPYLFRVGSLRQVQLPGAVLPSRRKEHPATPRPGHWCSPQDLPPGGRQRRGVQRSEEGHRNLLSVYFLSISR